jgi:tripartite-type tricarboxylate transporter receptor subunit TctC
MSKQFFLAALGSGIAAALVATANAQTFPTKPIKIIVPTAPSGPVIAKLNAELKIILEMPDVKEKFAAQGFASSWQSPQAFGAFVKSEIGKWGALVKSSGATTD